MKTDESTEKMNRYLPSLEGTYSTIREFTLIVFMGFTLVSMALFWGEVAERHDLPADSVAVIGWLMEGLLVLLLVWIALLVMVHVDRIGGGETSD